MARTVRAEHLRTSGIRSYSARTSVTRYRSRRRGDGFLCYYCKPPWFQVNPLLDMRTDRRSGISRSNRNSSAQGNSMGLPVREYTGSPNKPLHSECAYREGDSPRFRIAPTVSSAGGRRGKKAGPLQATTLPCGNSGRGIQCVIVQYGAVLLLLAPAADRTIPG